MACGHVILAVYCLLMCVCTLLLPCSGRREGTEHGDAGRHSTEQQLGRLRLIRYPHRPGHRPAGVTATPSSVLSRDCSAVKGDTQDPIHFDTWGFACFLTRASLPAMPQILRCSAAVFDVERGACLPNGLRIYGTLTNACNCHAMDLVTEHLHWTLTAGSAACADREECGGGLP